MSDIIKGVVEAVNRVDGPKVGDKPKWKKVSIKLKGEWYGGFLNSNDTDDRNKVAEGDAVILSFVKNGRYMNIEELKIDTSVPKVVASEAKVAVVTTEYVPSNIRDIRITVAGSRNAALEFIRLALDKEVITLKAKKVGDRVDELLDHVNYFTEVFAKQTLNATDVALLGANSNKNTTEKEADDSYTE